MYLFHCRLFYCRYESAFDPWLSSVWNALHEKDHMLLPRTDDNLDASSRFLDPPKFKVIYHTVNETTDVDSSALSGKVHFVYYNFCFC